MVKTAKQAEAAVERQRLALEHTLGDLRNHLKPTRLVGEVLSGGDWFDHLQTFARTSPVSWTIMTVAAIAIGVQTSRRTMRSTAGLRSQP